MLLDHRVRRRTAMTAILVDLPAAAHAPTWAKLGQYGLIWAKMGQCGPTQASLGQTLEFLSNIGYFCKNLDMSANRMDALPEKLDSSPENCMVLPTTGFFWQ